MADNVLINPGTTTAVATDAIGTVQYQIVKLDVGADGVSAPLSSSNPLPTTSTVTAGTITKVTNLAGGSVIVTSGTIDSLPNISGSVVMTVGTISSIPPISGSVAMTAGTITSIPDIDINSGTITKVTNIASGSIVMTSGTIASLPNISGSVVVTAGTIVTNSVMDYNTETPAMLYNDINGNLLTAIAQLPKENGDGIYANGSQRDIKFKSISTGTAGVNGIVDGIADIHIRVLSLSLSINAVGNAKFQGGATDITGLRYMGTLLPWDLPYNKLGWFETEAGSALNLNLSAGTVGGCLSYVEV